MGLTNYVSAMDCWKGRIDSTTDYDAFRWHQWVQPLDLNIQTEKPECGLERLLEFELLFRNS